MIVRQKKHHRHPHLCPRCY
ncbi:hypothetical protein DIU31_004580 [Mucilaginibacter rubeus]|uniref:Zinc finger FPG/IleRS-type domain-containing protein n=1 Tax=Mucilaginibacter rubeus TaxID=2027860 RepID=A0AAE6MLT2_9SPHI|nr:hypothetical protein DIU31_004580 [Mucilaginibacter rubeus]QEM20630.1 hypothetical protein DIU38_004630 [Mucilaginibacter gossypii]QTE47111.1 hypothetical protein J3L19_23160 [Mucilaginibacter rubeus]QTE53713.1 hypothetical protein J3L21_23145 [Mucilaginibacter rubeus]QTE60214.1 hypothetical protein J3L23_14780 [Mucilaginibacter rubeus]